MSKGFTFVQSFRWVVLASGCFRFLIRQILFIFAKTHAFISWISFLEKVFIRVLQYGLALPSLEIIVTVRADHIVVLFWLLRSCINKLIYWSFLCLFERRRSNKFFYFGCLFPDCWEDALFIECKPDTFWGYSTLVLKIMFKLVGVRHAY